jgi:hypothetical protein
LFLRKKETNSTVFLCPRIGDYVIGLSLPGLFHRADETAEANRRAECFKVQVGLALTRTESGQYPEKLDALVPKYLPGLPDDSVDRPATYLQVGDGYRLSNIPPKQHGTTPVEMLVEVAR